MFKGTAAEKVRFHDDKASYTGAHKNGGPSTKDGAKVDLANLMDRGAADARGVPT